MAKKVKVKASTSTRGIRNVSLKVNVRLKGKTKKV